MPDRLLTELSAFAVTLRRGKAVNVNDAVTKEIARTLITKYFAEVRPALVSALGDDPELLSHDEMWQRLLRLTQANSARKSYLNSVGALSAQLRELNVAAASKVMLKLAAARTAGVDVQITADEQLVVRTLEKLVPSAATSYLQGCRDLRSGKRVSYRGTATEFREALREVLHHLAPDAEVTAQEGFKPEDGQNKPTMRQRAKFILSKRRRNKTQQEAAARAIDVVEGLVGGVARAIYDRASLATHTQETEDEVRQLKRYVDTVLFDLLETGKAD